jgi:hypothetical protein
LDRAQLRLPEDVLDGHARISHWSHQEPLEAGRVGSLWACKVMKNHGRCLFQLVSEDLEGSALQESIIVNPSVFLCPKAPRQIGSIPWAGTTSTPATMAACWTRAMRISTATSCCTRQSPSSSTAPGAWCLLGWVALAPDQQIILWVIQLTVFALAGPWYAHCIHTHVEYTVFISIFSIFTLFLYFFFFTCLLTSLLGCLVACLLPSLLPSFPACLLIYLLTYLLTYLYLLSLLYSNLLYLLSYLTLPYLTSPYLYFTLLYSTLLLLTYFLTSLLIYLHTYTHMNIHIPLSLSIVAPCESFLLEIIHVCGRFPRSYDSMDLPDQHSWVLWIPRAAVSSGIYPSTLDISGHLWTMFVVLLCSTPLLVEHGWPSWLKTCPFGEPQLDSWHELVKPPQVSYQGQRQGQFPGEVARACGGSLRGMPSPTDRLRDLRCLKKSAGQRGVNSVVFLKNSRKWSQF